MSARQSGGDQRRAGSLPVPDVGDRLPVDSSSWPARSRLHRSAHAGETRRSEAAWTLLRVSALVLLVIVATGAWAQGTITSGDLQFELHAEMNTIDGNADLRWRGIDQVPQLWWWYRLQGGATELRFPFPDSQSYGAHQVALAWSDLDGRGIDVETILTVYDCSPGSCPDGGRALFDANTRVLNSGDAAVSLQLFTYIDLDIAGTAVSDRAQLLSDEYDRIGVLDGPSSMSFFFSPNEQYQVAPYPTLRSSLDDGDADDLDGSGLPFGPGDVTFGLQRVFDLDAGNGVVDLTLFFVIDEVSFFDGFESGDTSEWSTASGASLEAASGSPAARSVKDD